MILLVSVLLFSLYIGRIVTLRHSFSSYGILEYEEGEEFEGNGLLLHVLDSALFGLEEYEEMYGALSPERREEVEKHEIHFIRITLQAENRGAETIVYPFLETILLQGLTWAWNYSREMTEFAGFPERRMELAPGEEKEYTLFYALTRPGFQSRFDEIFEQKMYLSFCLEANKKMVLLSSIQKI